jgi:hypothetical protein
MPLSYPPVRLSSRPHDGPAGTLGVGQHEVYLFRREDVVGEFDTRSAVITQCSPKSEHHPTRLEEAHFGVRPLSTTPAQRLVEAASAGQTTHAESYEADALFQVESIPRRLPPKKAPPNDRLRVSATAGSRTAASGGLGPRTPRSGVPNGHIDGPSGPVDPARKATVLCSSEPSAGGAK